MENSASLIDLLYDSSEGSFTLLSFILTIFGAYSLEMFHSFNEFSTVFFSARFLHSKTARLLPQRLLAKQLTKVFQLCSLVFYHVIIPIGNFMIFELFLFAFVMFIFGFLFL